MSLSAKAIDALVAAGASAEMLAAVMKADLSALEEKRAEKREADRIRKQRERAKTATVHNVTRDTTESEGHGVTVADNTDNKEAPAPTYTRGEDNLSRLVDTRIAVAVVAEAREPGSDWPKGDAHQHAKLLVAEANSHRLDPNKEQLLVRSAGLLEAWRRDGASWVFDVIPVVTTIARARGSPIKSWKFFDPAIAQSIADNRRALDIPAANGPRHERPDQPSAKLAAKQANMERAFRGAQSAAARRAL